MKKQEAARILKRIRKYFFNSNYPLKHVMFDQEVTVGQKFDEALKVLLSRKKRKRPISLEKYLNKPVKEDVKEGGK